MSEKTRDAVRKGYGAVAQAGLSSSQGGIKGIANAFGYSDEELSSIPAEANMGLSCGNPVAMAAGAAQIEKCLEPGFYDSLETKTQAFVAQIMDHANAKNYPFRIHSMGSIFWLAFSLEDIQAASAIEADTMSHFTILHRYLLEHGVHVGPSGYEVGFVSAVHTEEDLAQAAQVMCDALDTVFS